MQLQNELVKKLGLKGPLIVAPMAAGPTTPDLVGRVSKAGALGSIAGAYATGSSIEDLARRVRLQTEKPFAVNLFIQRRPEPFEQSRLKIAIEATKEYRRELGIPLPQLSPPFEENFDQQFTSVLKIGPQVLSFIFGVLPEQYVRAAKRERIFLIGTATQLSEALALEASGVDAIVLQGNEAGGHRGIFDSDAKDPEIPVLQLVEMCCEKIKIPLIAAGGIMNATHVGAALKAGASAVQMGTAFLACEEAGTSGPYKRQLLDPAGRETKTTRVFSGRLARGIVNRFMREMDKRPTAILPYPQQNKFTRDIRAASVDKASSDFLSMWSGTGKGALWTGPAGLLVENIFEDLESLA